jgi:site-specific recombinase XerD
MVHGKRRFRVWIGRPMTGGKPKQRYFKTEAEADLFVKQTKEVFLREGQQAFALSYEQRFEALKCLQKLTPFNVSLMEAVEHYIAHNGARISNQTVDQAVEEFLKSCKRNNLKPRSIAQYVSDLSVFSETFGKSKMVGITREDIEEWLDESDWSARTKRNKLTTLATFYGFGIEKGFCNLSPVEKIKRPKVDDEVVGLLTPAQTAALFQQAVKDRPQMVGALAIAAFAGLRRSELCALTWDEVHLKEREIEVKASKAKTRQRRVVTINDTLAKWLELYAGKKGQLTSTSSSDVWGKWVRDMATKAGITTWPKNALRHGFGSYFFALIKDENRVAAEMGNSPAMVHRHYRALVNSADCQSFWSILPAIPATGATKPPITAHENHANN